MVAVVALTAPPAAAQLSALISINNNWVRQYSKKHDVNKHTHEKTATATEYLKFLSGLELTIIAKPFLNEFQHISLLLVACCLLLVQIYKSRPKCHRRICSLAMRVIHIHVCVCATILHSLPSFEIYSVLLDSLLLCTRTPHCMNIIYTYCIVFNKSRS